MLGLFKYSFVLMMLLGLSAQSQCPTTNFSIPATSCIYGNVEIENFSTPGNTYVWDFCSGDLATTASATEIFTSSFLARVRSFKMVQSAGSWYGFAIDQVNNRLLRFDFGASLSSTPSMTNLGNLGNQLQNPYDFFLYEENNLWYALVANSAANNILRLQFGSNITAAPVTADLGTFGVISLPTGIFGVTENGLLSVFVNNGSVAQLVRLDFGTSINNTATPTVYPMAFGSGLQGISLIKECDRWFGLVTSYGNAKLLYLDFINGINQAPAIGEFAAGLPFPATVTTALEGGTYYAFIQSAFPGNLFRVDFGSSIIDKTGTLTDLGNLSGTGGSADNFAFTFAHQGSEWFGFFVDNAGSRLMRLTFPSPCHATTAVSNAYLPVVSYTQPGTYKISQSVTDANGNLSSQAHSIVINNYLAPDINFTVQNICANHNAIFTSQNVSANIGEYEWNFGDAGTSTQQNPTHQYSIPGNYNVTLQVSTSNGCQNFIQKSIKIYDPPVASFTLPSGLICTNNQFMFTNNTIDNFEGNLTYQWYVDNALLATTRYFNYAFTTTGNKDIKLKTSIPGCSSDQMQTLTNVLPGPVVGYTITGKCENENIAFTNTSTGSITGYSWDFGNGQASTLTNPTQNYSKGNYAVSLQAAAINGCVSAVTKNLTIYSLPQPNFSVGLPPFSCAGTATQFTDMTPAPTDSNIATWNWNFGDAANGISSLKNPSYSYATANTYNVSLSVATNFGCTNAVQKTVTISASPVASFSNLPACVNQPTQFTDASAGNIKSRLWQIQNSTFTTPNPQFTYASSGTFPAVLTVTGNNNCVSQVTKNIVVPIVPSLDFSALAPCATVPTVFTELTSPIDPPVSRSWSFGNQATGSGSPAQYSFSSTGNYVVRLTSTRQSGCAYSVSKNVTILAPPVADFAPSIDAGAAPLPVVFANLSTGANSYLWKFGDQSNTTSSLASPTFVFSELGAYNVELSASNTVGCTNRLTKIINVVIPNIDGEMTDFFFVKDPKTSALQPVVKLLNKSNITLINPMILLDVAGGSSITKQLAVTIKPSQEFTQVLDLQVVPRTNQYVCAELVLAGDTDTFLNRRCLSLSGEEVLFAPFPNPAREQLNMDWISLDGSAVTFQVLTSTGTLSFQQTVSPINTGLNRLVINTSNLQSGVYFIRFRDSQTERTFSFVAMGN